MLGGIDEVRSRARDIEQQRSERRLRLTFLALVQHLTDEAHGEQRDSDEEPSNADAETLPEPEPGQLVRGCGCHSGYDSESCKLSADVKITLREMRKVLA